jgi:hypothetical protein
MDRNLREFSTEKNPNRPARGILKCTILRVGIGNTGLYLREYSVAAQTALPSQGIFGIFPPLILTGEYPAR